MEQELSRITSKILDEAKSKSDEIVKQGKGDAKSITDEAKVRSKGTADRIIKEAEREAEQVKKRQVADATIQARKKKLGAREDLINKTFSGAEKKLDDLSKSSKYPSILERLLSEACAEIGKGNIEVIVRKEDAKTISEKFKNLEKTLKDKGTNVKLSLSKESTSSLGVIARSVDGNVVVSNTLESRLSRIRPTIRLEVAKILFK